MRRIREVLRLRFDCQCTYEEIARSVAIGRSTAADCVIRFEASGLVWPLASDMNDLELERRLYHIAPQTKNARPLPNWADIHFELRRKGVTKQLLWMEYKLSQPDGYEYTQFCNLYKKWQSHADLVFRNHYTAGEKCFVDYAGQTVPIHDAKTGKVSHAQIFVAVLGASNFTYAEATHTQTLSDWIVSHIRALTYFGGVPSIMIPDNLKSGVQRPCRYDPIVNPTYNEMARHYGFAVIPARVRKPRDKAKAEVAVQIVERWILAALRKRKFFSLEELNHAISLLLDKLNNRPFKKLEGCRKSAFEQLEKQALKPLPSYVFELAEFKQAKVNINYHITLDDHSYSVPFQLVQKEVMIRHTNSIVEILFGGTRVASHPRKYKKYEYTTLQEHMPPKHAEHIKWTPERMANWAGEAGASTKQVAEKLMHGRQHPQQGFNAVLGLIRLGDQYGRERLENACLRALKIGSPSHGSVKSILKTGLDKSPLPGQPEPKSEKAIEHENIRGPDYFN